VRLRHDLARSSWVLLAPETIFEINHATQAILERCDGERTLADIVEGLAALYAADRLRIEADVQAVLQGLLEKRLIEL